MEDAEQDLCEFGDLSLSRAVHGPFSCPPRCWGSSVECTLLTTEQEHFRSERDGKPRMADKPGVDNSGSQCVEFPTRFFARDFAGNRLEFSL